MFLILTLIILVAAFNIVSSLIMLVKDKGRDIAVLRTMGATRGAILRIFLLCGASVGVAGHADRLRHRHRLLLEHRGHPPGHPGAERDGAVQPGGLFPLAPAGGGGSAGGDAGGRHGPRTVAAGDDLSKLAGREDRPGRGAAQ
jgi:hypothetical protein